MYDYYGQYGQYGQYFQQPNPNVPAAAGSALPTYQNPVLQTPVASPVSSVPQPTGSDAAATVSHPDATSSPRIPRPVYENISDDSVMDNSAQNIVPNHIVMNNSTVNASAILSASKDLGNLSLTRSQLGSEAVSSSANLPDTAVRQKQSASMAANQLVIQESANHNVQNALQNPAMLPVQDAIPVLDMQNNNGEAADQQVQAPSFPQNIFHLPSISQSKRITTAYKYVPFVRRVQNDPRPVSEARGSDDEEIPPKPEEVSENSFPIASYIQESWQYQNASFKETLKKALVASDKITPAESQENTAGENAENGENSTDPKKSQDDFSLYASNFGSILKGKPVKKQSDFHYNEPLFAAFVELDGDINKLRRDDRKKWEIGLRLTPDEIKNIQLAMAYNLYADSHLSAFLKASRAAVNRVLLTLDPELHSENISTLHDVKYMLTGGVMAMEQNVRNSIYVHAGITAQIRADFLKAQGNYIPTHIKQSLLHENFGGSGIFNSQIHKYTAEIAAHNDKIHQNKVQSALNKQIIQQNQSQQSQSISQPQNSYDGYKIPRKQFQNNAGQTQGQGQQDQGGAGRGRGRGNQSNRGARNAGQQNQNNRGGGRGQGRGFRGKKKN